MRLLTVIYSAYCTNPKCLSCCWYAQSEPENPERQFQPVEIAEALKCAWCRRVFPSPGSELSGSERIWQTYKTPNGAVGMKDSPH